LDKSQGLRPTRNKLMLTVIMVLAVHLLATVWLGLRDLDLQLEQFRQRQVAHQKAMLKQRVDIVIDVLRGLEPQELRTRLRHARFGSDGYYFVYDFNGVNQVQDPRPEFEGKSLIDLQDAQGRKVIRELLSAARFGDGFYSYHWPKPSQPYGHFAKLSYVQVLPDQDWIIGTGIYLAEVDRQVADMQSQMEQGLWQRLKHQLQLAGLWLLLLWAGTTSMCRRLLFQPAS